MVIWEVEERGFFNFNLIFNFKCLLVFGCRGSNNFFCLVILRSGTKEESDFFFLFVSFCVFGFLRELGVFALLVQFEEEDNKKLICLISFFFGDEVTKESGQKE